MEKMNFCIDEKSVHNYPCTVMDVNILPLPDDCYRFKYPNSGVELESIPSSAHRSLDDYNLFWHYLQMPPSGNRPPMKIKHRGCWFSSYKKFSFEYVAPLDSVELVGKYTWKFDRTKKQYFLTKNGNKTRVFATLATCPYTRNRLSGNMQIFHDPIIRGDCIGKRKYPLEMELELDVLIHLTAILILFSEEKYQKLR